MTPLTNVELLQAEIDRLKLRYAQAVLDDPTSPDTVILQTCLMDVILIDLVGKEIPMYVPGYFIRGD